MPRPGGTVDRGYGYDHATLRAQLTPTVAQGHTICWRCGRPIGPHQRWDLGHDDIDRSLYRGPEHVRCNRRAGAIKGNRLRGRRAAITQLTRPQLPTYSDPEW